MPVVARRDIPVVAAGALGGLLLLWVTAAPPARWIGPPGTARLDSVLGPLILWLRGSLPQQEPQNVPRPGRPAPHHQLGGWVDVAATVATVLLLLAATVAVVLLLRRFLPVLLAWWAARRRRAAALAPVPDEEDVADVVVADAGGQLAALEQGLPRNAIVACWMRLEDAAARVGLPRRESETSAEFTRRVIGTHLVGTTAIERLAALYREARFSHHPMTEADRDTARAALETLHQGLRRATGTRLEAAGRAREVPRR